MALDDIASYELVSDYNPLIPKMYQMRKRKLDENVPGGALLPRTAADELPDVFTWLLHQGIVAKVADVNLNKLSEYGVVNGPDVLELTEEELTKAGFKVVAVRKLLTLKKRKERVPDRLFTENLNKSTLGNPKNPNPST